MRRLAALMATLGLTCACGGDDFSSSNSGGTNSGGAAGTSIGGSAGSGGQAGAGAASAGGTGGTPGTGGANTGGSSGANTGGANTGGANTGGAAGGGGTGGASTGGAGGAPLPITLATNQSGVEYPALDENYVYWTTGTAMRRVQKNAAGGVQTLSTVGQGNEGCAVDSTHAYWADAGGGVVYRVPLIGGTTTTVAVGQGQVQTVAVDATHAYWAGGGVVGKRVKDASSPTETIFNTGSPFAVALSSTHVYWLSLSSTVFRRLKTGGTPEQVTTVSGSANRVALSIQGSDLFFTLFYNAGPTGSVRSSTSTPGSSSVEWGVDPAEGAASDGTHLYWAAQGIGASTNGRIRRRLLSGGPVENFATNQDWPRGVVTDATAVYWVNFNSGQVMKRLK